jgi:glycine cleavage system H protein
MEYPANLKYTSTHEWVKVEGAIAVVGITDYAQHELGDVVFVEFPEIGAKATQFADLGNIESAKAVGELKSPVSGEVIEVNSALDGAFEKINASPYGDGWLVKIKMSDPGELTKLMDASQYQASLSK